MFSASITLLNGSPFHSPVTRKCIYHLHKTKLAVASSDKRNPREFEDCYSLPIFTFIANTFNGASHTMSSENGVLHVIGVFNGKLSTIAHECAHMAFDICSRVGVDVEPGRANETYCYLMSRLVEFCERHIKKPE